VLDEVPDAVSKGDCDGEAHRDVGTEVPGFFSFLAAVTQDEHGQDDIDDDVGERVVLLFGSGRGRFVRSGHFMGRRDAERARERAGPLRKKLIGNLRGVNGISSAASLLHAVAEGLLGFLETAALGVALSVSDFAVDLEHAFDVLSHVSDDGAGECVLRVGVDVHLHDAVVEGLLKVVAGSS